MSLIASGARLGLPLLVRTGYQDSPLPTWGLFTQDRQESLIRLLWSLIPRRPYVCVVESLSLFRLSRPVMLARSLVPRSRIVKVGISSCSW